MSQEKLPNDPVLNAAYNAALEWAANWITGAQMLGRSEEVIEFAKNMAMSIRAAKRGLTKRVPDASPDTCEHGFMRGNCYVEVCEFSKYGERR